VNYKLGIRDIFGPVTPGSKKFRWRLINKGGFKELFPVPSSLNRPSLLKKRTKW
jgi:hypothetical protein